jgi:hypothetical protein
MAENWLQFSEVISQLTPNEESWLRTQLQWIAVQDGREIEVDDQGLDGAVDGQWVGPRFLRDYEDEAEDYDPSCGELGFQFDFHDDHDTPDGWGRHLWLYAEDGGEPNHAAWLVRKFLRRFRPDQCWSLTWSTSCSKPRVGEFGGGAVFVTATAIRWQNAYDFVERLREVFSARAAAGGAEPCDCERPGYFYCGVPGILAHVENGQLTKGAIIERCDQCLRYPSDELAVAKLRESGIA